MNIISDCWYACMEILPLLYRREYSSKIVSAFLAQEGFENYWVDARSLIRTDNTYRNARIDWTVTKNQIHKEKRKGVL